ncbi:riboflavin biosynthesis protein RibF [Tetragenococcus muriaticus]|uniref:Riboflavin biosynthesis protein n=2 Tax=Tetragenococcus muriaticus TaxID=64642 RepID=A0A091CD17_9ENTE|nr:riboflavin biosynthesis protein RibF [Tetragenococcus muriaticus]KFN91303.1 riboflavin kinase/FMN adenylyltransferase [Tetragenococcus muriaticus 3MR10-3]KFN91751.1 riboflavin kinase/FMN adenylyltransferase [Tetragenococcus muriaticus PMC-11-5]GMA47262.1 riboflavin biosynthesis protein [Tetragenococcus muriaticus]GMA48571.1 riboflavin biosynthesis protein [Tetragenococcus muriaticus]GMA48611.1 riboflavin biosynthesis protein [Tetragenococcus muriaticus]
MEVIELRHPYTKETIPEEEVVLVLGFFDGVHKGHQKVIETGRKIANKQGLKLAVMTFNQHPSIVFKKTNPNDVKYLTSLEQKERLMSQLGVDYLYIVDFTSLFASLSPQEFVDKYIIDLHAKYAVAGFDYTYGLADVANMQRLPQYSRGYFEVVTVSKKTQDSDKISSTRIRECLDQGNMEKAADLLGYTYEIDGIVVHGDARGRTLGFPTANIKVDSNTRLPKEGVYATEIKIGETWYPAMGSIGHNDTFEQGRQLTVEVYILDFTQDVYGEQVSVQWNHLLRDQVAFNGAEELIQQLKKDEEDTRQYFAAMKR